MKNAHSFKGFAIYCSPMLFKLKSLIGEKLFHLCAKRIPVVTKVIVTFRKNYDRTCYVVECWTR